jgi:nicotinic acid mononucleotide adenylyltransferase
MSETKKQQKICLFGLSADPVTGEQGHVGIVKELVRLDCFDEIWVLPVYKHTYEVRSTVTME